MILTSTFSLAWLVASLAIAAYLYVAIKPSVNAKDELPAFFVAWLAHASTLAMGLAAGKFGFGPAVSMTAWWVLTVYAVERMVYPDLKSMRFLVWLGAAAAVVGVVFPGARAHGHGLLWLLHGALGVAAYGMLAAASIHASILMRDDRRFRTTPASGTRSIGLPLLTLERLMMAFSAAAFLMLSVSLLAGWWLGLGSADANGRWFFNHKTLFSLLAWVCLATLMLGRAILGWRGRLAARWIFSSAVLLLLGYVGSRFVLEVILRQNL